MFRTRTVIRPVQLLSRRYAYSTSVSTRATARFHLDTKCNDLYFHMDGVEVTSAVSAEFAGLRVILDKDAEVCLEDETHTLWLQRYGSYQEQETPLHLPLYGRVERRLAIKRAISRYGPAKIEIAFQRLAIELAKHIQSSLVAAADQTPLHVPTDAKIWTVHGSWTVEEAAR